MKIRFLILGLCMLAEISIAQQTKHQYKGAIGIQAYTFRHSFPKNVIATLDTIRAMGITELEGNAPKGFTETEFKKLCNERGISIPSTGSSFEELEQNPQAIADKAKALGAKYVMCAWIPHQSKNFTLENAQKAVEVFNKAGKVLKENGLTFCYHDHGYEFQPYKNETLLDYIIKNTKPEYVSFEMDVLWTIHGGGNPVALLKKYGNRWKLMHIKDLKKGIKGDFSGHTSAENDVVLGTGQADFLNIFKEANKIGMKHFFIEDESDNEFVNVPLSIKYLKSL